MVKLFFHKTEANILDIFSQVNNTTKYQLVSHYTRTNNIVLFKVLISPSVNHFIVKCIIFRKKKKDIFSPAYISLTCK
jgi:hypothetical protein